jgi:DNA-binding CsgD family transcriptional regulator
MQTLTRRERQVVDLLVLGLSGTEMGARLGISRRTVEIHRRAAMLKLNAGSLPQLCYLMGLFDGRESRAPRRMRTRTDLARKSRKAKPSP